MVRTCQNLIQFLILAVALLIWHGNITAIEIKDFVVQIICLLILLISILRLLFLERIVIHKNPVILLSFLYITLMVVAYFFTNRVSLNTKALIPQVYGVLIFIFVTHYFQKHEVKLIIFFSVVAATLAAIYGVIQYFYFDPLDWAIPGFFQRGLMVSFFGHKNYFAIYLLLMAPLGIFLIISSEHKIPFFMATLSTGVMILALALSRSRGALVSFLLTAFFGLVLYVFKRRGRIFKITWTTITFWSIAVLFFLMIVFLPKNIRQDFKGITQQSTIRLDYYKAALEVIGRNPFQGVGPGNFVISYPLNKKYKVLSDDPNQVLNHVHNDFLEIWAEYGTLTFLTYLSIIALFAITWSRRFRETNDVKQQLQLIFILCSINGYLFYSLFTVAGRYMSSTFYFWLVMAIGYLCLQTSSETGRYLALSNNLRRYNKTIYVAVACVILLFGIAIKTVVTSYVSDTYIKKAVMLTKQNKYDAALYYLSRAVYFRPKTAEAYYQRGFIYFAKNMIDNSIQEYTRVHDMAPNYINVNFNLASCYYRKRDWPNVIRWAANSQLLYPDYIPAVMMLANTYYYIRQPQRALYYCNLILEKEPGHRKAQRLKKRLGEVLGSNIK